MEKLKYILIQKLNSFDDLNKNTLTKYISINYFFLIKIKLKKSNLSSDFEKSVRQQHEHKTIFLETLFDPSCI